MTALRENGSPVAYGIVPAPIGDLIVANNEQGAIVEILFAGRAVPESWRRDDRAVRDAAEQLHSYFGGRLRRFDLPLALTGTPFQLSVWDALQAIPFGETRSYLDIARAIGNEAACRAVGAANGRNPIPIVIPCHRVIGASGALTGFGGGLDVKRALLALESGTTMPLFAMA